MTLLVYGWRGWLGGNFMWEIKRRKIHYVLGLARVDDIVAVESEIRAIQPTHVVSFIGRTHGKVGKREYKTIDYLEQPGKLAENVRDNLFAPVVLANLSVKYGFHYTYIGSGCIFEYDTAHPMGDVTKGYTENDRANFVGSQYSTMKGFTDQMMKMYSDTTLNVRIRMPITGDMHPRNFITKLVSYKKVCSMPNSMTVLPTLFPVLVEMIIKGHTGTINLCNPGVITHNEVLEMYKEIVDPTHTWENMTCEEQTNMLAAGRSNTCLDTSKLVYMSPKIKNIHDAMRDVMADIKRGNMCL